MSSIVAVPSASIFKRGEELIDFDEACIEIRAQHDRFVEIVGREPDYFEAHAVMSKKTLTERSRRLLRNWALRNRRRASTPRRLRRCGATDLRMVMHSMEPGYEPKDSIMRTVREMADGETVVFVCHPGYLDRFILENSSLTTDRTKRKSMR